MRGMVFRFCGCVVAMPIAAWLLPGVHTANPEVAWIAGALLGIIYLVLRPIAKLLLTPFNCLTFGIMGFVVDVLFVRLAAQWAPDFDIDGFWWAVATSLIVSALRESVGKLGERKK
jgi:Predicted membrane protein